MGECMVVSASSMARLLHSFFNKSLLYNVAFSSRFETCFSLQMQPMRFRHTFDSVKMQVVLLLRATFKNYFFLYLFSACLKCLKATFADFLKMVLHQMATDMC